jgi:hypothetical protein
VRPPDSFPEAVFVVEKMMHQNPELKKIAGEFTSSNEFVTALHHGLGQHIRNDWRLWIPKSRLSEDIKNTFSLFHADDMSSLIIAVAWQRYNNMPEQPFSIAHEYLVYWKNMKDVGEWDGQADGGSVPLEFGDIQKAYMEMEDRMMLAHIEALKTQTQ